MFEEDEGVLPVLGLYALHPFLEVRIAIVGAAQAQVAPVRRGYEGYLQVIFGFGDAKRGPMIAQNGEHFLVEPGLMTEFKRETSLRRQKRQEVAQQQRVLFQIRR